MNTLNHIVEPARLLLTWQPLDESAPSRTRRIVGEVLVEPDGNIVFRYLKDTTDFEEAKKAGFLEFPSFDITTNEIKQGVIDSLLRRLPPRRREDFSDYLKQHQLPFPFNYSDMALLGYTGARLPSDGFSLVLDLPPNAVPCDFLMEVAGLRHIYPKGIQNIHVGDIVTFEIDAENPVDGDALAVMHQGHRIGYVNRAIKSNFHGWLRNHHIESTVERITGKPERPLVYLRVHVT